MRSLLVPATLALSTALVAAAAQLPNAAEHPAIAYSTSTPTDAVAQLQARLDARFLVALERSRGVGSVPSIQMYSAL